MSWLFYGTDVALKHMHEQIQQIQNSFRPDLAEAATLEQLEQLEKNYLGRSGKVQDLFNLLPTLAPTVKKEWGQKLNQLKQALQKQVDQKKASLQMTYIEELDVTVQKKLPLLPTLHPLTQLMMETEDIFSSMGFTVWDGPEVDTEYYNFESLNIPKDHPARDMQDTFYLEQEPYVLRTQTSNMQNRILKNGQLPIRAIVPGRVFRVEATDASHDMTFHQVEGIMVDQAVSIAHMRYTMESFLQTLFQKSVRTRLRPGYFPFVEPGMELDFSCTICDGTGCRVCKHTGWVEFMGCGMIHPTVLKEGNVDPEKYTGFAFGFGLTRLVMMRYKIDDIRLLHGGDLRFLSQFK